MDLQDPVSVKCNTNVCSFLAQNIKSSSFSTQNHGLWVYITFVLLLLQSLSRDRL